MRPVGKDSGTVLSDEDEQEEPRAGLVFVDPDEKSRHAAESLEEALSCSILAVDASEFDPEACEEIQRAAAFVVCWDLGTRTGADLLESIRANERIRDGRILVAMDEPTRTRVRVALQLGADAVCRRPYDADELAVRLEKLGLSRPVPGG